MSLMMKVWEEESQVLKHTVQCHSEWSWIWSWRINKYNTGQRVLLNEENNKNNSEILNLKSINQFWPMMIAAVKKNILIIFLGTLGFVMPIPVLRIYPIMRGWYIMNANCQNIVASNTTSCSCSNELELIISIEGQDIHSFKGQLQCWHYHQK